jgi:hypothetical protein
LVFGVAITAMADDEDDLDDDDDDNDDGGRPLDNGPSSTRDRGGDGDDNDEDGEDNDEAAAEWEQSMLEAFEGLEDQTAAAAAAGGATTTGAGSGAAASTGASATGDGTTDEGGNETKAAGGGGTATLSSSVAAALSANSVNKGIDNGAAKPKRKRERNRLTNANLVAIDEKRSEQKWEASLKQQLGYAKSSLLPCHSISNVFLLHPIEIALIKQQKKR